MHFFSVFYFAINFGSFLSMILTPIIRGEYSVKSFCIFLFSSCPNKEA